MEYVSIDALKFGKEGADPALSSLHARFADTLPDGHVLATDDLQLIQGIDIVDEARAKGKKVVPLRRVQDVKQTRRFPKRVLLELTTACNSDCTMCPRNVLTRKIEHMDTGLAKRAIDELAEVGLSGLWLYNIGESLLHPDFYEILEHCRKYDNLGTIWLSTNGQYLDKEKIEMLLDQPVDILNYSVNAMSSEHFKKIAPALEFETVQENLKTLIRRKQERKVTRPVIRAQIIEIPSVMHEIDWFLEAYGGEADILSINKLEEFSQNVSANTNANEEVQNNTIDVCNRLEREDFFIFADGSVSCCDTDFNCTMNIGSVRKNTVQEIFDGALYQGLIEKYKQGALHEMELCSKCRDYAL